MKLLIQKRILIDQENLSKDINARIENVLKDILPGVKVIDMRFVTEDYLQVTGFELQEELLAYECGRNDEQRVITKFIENWNGETNSHMGQLLYKKLTSLRLVEGGQ